MKKLILEETNLIEVSGKKNYGQYVDKVTDYIWDILQNIGINPEQVDSSEGLTNIYIDFFDIKADEVKKVRNELEKHFVKVDVHGLDEDDSAEENFFTFVVNGYDLKTRLDEDGFEPESSEALDELKELRAEPIMQSGPEADPVEETFQTTGLTMMISDAIKAEWDTINQYNSMIATLKEENKNEVIDILNDIVNEEMIHVGQLQKVLELINPDFDNIEKGKEEAEEQLNSSN